jgi:hypothetical protein
MMVLLGLPTTSTTIIIIFVVNCKYIYNTPIKRFKIIGDRFRCFYSNLDSIHTELIVGVIVILFLAAGLACMRCILKCKYVFRYHLLTLCANSERLLPCEKWGYPFTLGDLSAIIFHFYSLHLWEILPRDHKGFTCKKG